MHVHDTSDEIVRLTEQAHEANVEQLPAVAAAHLTEALVRLCELSRSNGEIYPTLAKLEPGALLLIADLAVDQLADSGWPEDDEWGDER